MRIVYINDNTIVIPLVADTIRNMGFADEPSETPPKNIDISLDTHNNSIINDSVITDTGANMTELYKNYLSKVV